MVGIDRAWGDGSTTLLGVDFEFWKTVTDPPLA